MSDSSKEEVIHLALPKGHMQENIFKLLEEAGMKVRSGAPPERTPAAPSFRLPLSRARLPHAPRSPPAPRSPVSSSSVSQVTLGNSRGYRPSIPIPSYDVKLLKVRGV
jgi:hypothetical protein